MGIGAVAEPFSGLADVLFLDDGGELVAAVEGGQDGGIAVDGKAAGDILEVFLIAMDAVDDDDTGVLLFIGGASHVGRDRVAVIAGVGDLVALHVGEGVDGSRRGNLAGHDCLLLVILMGWVILMGVLNSGGRWSLSGCLQQCANAVVAVCEQVRI